MAKDLDVVARLKLFTGDAERRLGRLSASLKKVARGAKTVDSSFARFAKRAAAIGGMYLGFRAISGALRHVVGSAYKFESSVQQTKIGLQTMVSNIEGMSFDQAGKGADYLWERLRKLSVQSVATTEQLHEAFAGSYGPMRAAGAKMDDILKTSKNLVHASGALGIDMPQAIRDMAMMATGRALTQVKLFQRLRTAGFLKNSQGGMMDAKEWNALSAPERTQRLIDVLAKFEDAGGAAAAILAGRMSTLKDLYQHLRKALFSPSFKTLADAVGRLNKWLLDNFDRMRAYFDGLGSRLANKVAPALQWMGDKLADFGENFELRIDIWVDKFGRFLDIVQTLTPILAKAAIAMGVISASKMIVSAGYGAAGAVTAGMAASAGAGGGMAGLGAALGVLAPAMLAVAAVALYLTTVWYTIKHNMTSVNIITASFSAALGELWPVLSKTFGLVWNIFTEIITIFGTLFSFITVSKLAILHKFVGYLKTFLEYVVIGLQVISEALSKFRKYMTELLGKYVRKLFPGAPRAMQRTAIPEIEETKNPFEDKTPGDRPKVKYEFNNATFNIKQDFRRADPDRVAIQMIEDLARQAAQRTTSGFAPALTG